MYMQEKDGCDFLFLGKNSNVDLEVTKMWKILGVDMKKELA